MQINILHKKFLECGSVTTDTRTLKGGEMFFALKGENFDGNEYALKALELGARYAVVNADSAVAACEDERLIKVDDTLKTLQATTSSQVTMSGTLLQTSTSRKTRDTTTVSRQASLLR